MRRKPLTVKVGKEKKKLSAMCARVCSFADVPNTKHSVKGIVRNGLRHQAGTEIQFFICLTVLNGFEISELIKYLRKYTEQQDKTCSRPPHLMTTLSKSCVLRHMIEVIFLF